MARWPLILASIAAGCAGQVQSLRAHRRHSREPAHEDVVKERIEDLEATVSLSRTLLEEVPYAPGDRWPRRLALSDDESDRIEDDLRSRPPYDDRDFQVAPASIYGRHVEKIVAEARAAAGDGHSPGLAEALAAASPTGGRVRELLAQLRGEERAIAALGARAGILRQAARGAVEVEAGQIGLDRDRVESDIEEARGRVKALGRDLGRAARELANEEWTRSDSGRRLARDFQSAVSAGYRLLAEGRALHGVEERHALLVLGRPDTRARRRLLEMEATLAEGRGSVEGTDPVSLSARYGAVGAELDARVPIFQRLGEALEGAADRDFDDAPGLASDDSLVDGMAGFAWDVVGLKGRAGGELLFFSNLVDQTTDPESDSDVTFDYSGRARHLVYRVQPVFLLGADAGFGLSLFRIPGFLTLKLGYGTDRFFRSGGRVSRSSSAASQLGIRGHASDLVEGALHAGGLDTGVKMATFDFGEVDVVDDATNTVEDTFPFQLEMLQVDVTYDLRHVIDEDLLLGVVDSVEVGFRYLEYRIPRILYEFEDTNPDPDQDDYVLVGETDFLQAIESRYFMGGIRIRSFDDPTTASHLVLDLGFYFGAGPGKFAYPGPNDERSQTFLALMIPLRLGYMLPLFPASFPVQLDLVAAYDVSLLHANTVGEGAETAPGDGEGSDAGTRVIHFGSTDFFHGPSLWLKGSL